MRWDKVAAMRSILLVVFGFAALAYGAFLLAEPAGWGVVGSELLLFAYLTDAPPAEVRR